MIVNRSLNEPNLGLERYVKTTHGWRYKNKMGSFRVIRCDMIQWLEIDIVMFFAKNRGKENSYFYAVVEEVKQQKSLIHWTTQTFSAWPLFNLCKSQTLTENLLFSWCFAAMIRQCLKQRRWRNMHVKDFGEWTGVMFTTIYLYNFEKIHPHNNVWHSKYRALILSIDTTNSCFENDFR